MPQFDTSTYFGQLFWFFLSFFSLYSFVKFFFLPKLDALLRVRASVLNENRRAVREIKRDLERLEGVRADTLSDVRFAAEKILSDAAISIEQLERDAAERLRVFAAQLNEENDSLVDSFFENESPALRELFMQLVQNYYVVIYAPSLGDREADPLDSLRKVLLKDFACLFERLKQCR